ncbi:MAG: hypothetical protein O7D94_06600 [Planctomycetota bacterium]|nr:hypothetical protein [Planctomycetota bacterium]
MENHKKSEVKELSLQEMASVDGGFRLRIQPLTWKYIDETPAWAVQAARDIGYDVENIS